MAMGISHGAARVFLRPAARPANHFGDEVLETRGRELVVRFVDCRVCIETRISHDPIDEIVDHHSDIVHAAEPLIESGRRLLG